MNRRRLLGLAACAPWLLRDAHAQGSRPVPRVGVLAPVAPDVVTENPNSTLPGFLAGMRERGYVAGANVVIDIRYAEHRNDRLPALAAELVASSPDVIYTWTNDGASAAAGATRKIPIVVGASSERSIARIVTNFARPEGNVTGLVLYFQEQEAKQIELLKESAPKAARVAVLANPANAGFRDHPAVLAPAARKLGFVLVRFEARDPSELGRAFEQIVASRMDAVIALDDATMLGQPEPRRAIAALALRHRLPSVSGHRGYAAAGGLIALGIDTADVGRRAAGYVDRILRGARPIDLPIERPTKLVLSVNLATARQIGVSFPQSLLVRADEVIE